MKRNNFKKMIYICSPYSGDIETNTENARRYSRFAVDNGYMPIAPHLLFPQFMSEKEEREEAMRMNIVLLGKCEQVWVFGDELTTGMDYEIAKAKMWNKTIRYFDTTCQEVNPYA